jgi:hypothetical protein
LVALAELLLRGSGFSRKEFTVVFVMAIFIFPLALPTLAAWANGHLDSGKATAHTVLVTGKQAHEEKYYLEVESWRKPGNPEKITVDRRLFAVMIPKQGRVIVSTQPGWLDYEWVVSYSVAD